MNNLIPSIGGSRNLPPTNVEEVISLTRAMNVYQFDVMVESAIQGINSLKPLLDRFSKISDLLEVVKSRVSSNYAAITVASLNLIPKTEESLREYFNSDGPVMGQNADEASRNIANLAESGIFIAARLEVPVLKEIDKKSGSPVTKELNWVPASELANMIADLPVKQSDFPGASKYVFITKDQEGNVTKETIYSVFGEYKNFRSTSADLSEAFTDLKELVIDLSSQVLMGLKFVQKVSDEANKKHESLVNFNKEQLQIAQKMESSMAEISEASLLLIKILAKERQISMNREEGKKQAAEFIRRPDDADLESSIRESFELSSFFSSSDSTPESKITDNNSDLNQNKYFFINDDRQYLDLNKINGVLPVIYLNFPLAEPLLSVASRKNTNDLVSYGSKLIPNSEEVLKSKPAFASSNVSESAESLIVSNSLPAEDFSPSLSARTNFNISYSPESKEKI